LQLHRYWNAHLSVNYVLHYVVYCQPDSYFSSPLSSSWIYVARCNKSPLFKL
jgi:hypothetical protein